MAFRAAELLSCSDLCWIIVCVCVVVFFSWGWGRGLPLPYGAALPTCCSARVCLGGPASSRPQPLRPGFHVCVYGTWQAPLFPVGPPLSACLFLSLSCREGSLPDLAVGSQRPRTVVVHPPPRARTLLTLLARPSWYQSWMYFSCLSFFIFEEAIPPSLVVLARP